METDLPDGVYRVTTSYFCAGFVVSGGRVVLCAPILRRRLEFFAGMAERIAD